MAEKKTENKPAPKKAAKKITLRQRMRADAAKRLEEIVATMRSAAIRVCEEHETEINPYDVMQMLVASSTKTVREQLIRDLANEAEKKLEALYNRQIGLIEEETNA